MDEITLFTEIRPRPPADLGHASEAARHRLTEAIATAASQPAANRTRRGLRPASGSRSRRLGLAAGSSRRRAGLVAAVAGAAAAAAIVVPATLPGNAAGSFVGKAWAVERQQDGSVDVSLAQEFNDPAGLQRALRADGIPAVVAVHSVVSRTTHGQHVWTFSCSYGRMNRAPAAVQRAAITFLSQRAGGQGHVPSVQQPSLMSPGEPAPSVMFVGQSAGKPAGLYWRIRPRAIPSGSILFMGTWQPRGNDRVAVIAGMAPVVLRGGNPPACVPTKRAS